MTNDRTIRYHIQNAKGTQSPHRTLRLGILRGAKFTESSTRRTMTIKQCIAITTKTYLFTAIIQLRIKDTAPQKFTSTEFCWTLKTGHKQRTSLPEGFGVAHHNDNDYVGRTTTASLKTLPVTERIAASRYLINRR